MSDAPTPDALWAQRLFGPGEFSRLTMTHASIAAADAFFAISLAGSLFFSVSVDAARPRILLYLILTMAPFAVVTPLIGPIIDRVRGGQRIVIVLTGAVRGGTCVMMADELRTLLFYPLAFSVLVLGKTYSVAKNTLVPRLVAESEALVWANSRLSRTATIAGALGSAAAAVVLTVVSAPWVLRVGGGLYLAASAFALRLPRPSRTASAARAVARAELRGASLRRAASAMGILRAGEGFLLFLLAFALKQSSAPAWLFGAFFAAAGLGGFAGTFVAPRVNRVVREEVLLGGGVVATAVAALLTSLGPGRSAVLVMALTLGMAASVGRRGFDSIVQREAPDIERGRLFARFETRFQLAWVIGAFAAVAVRPPLWAGFLLLGAVAGFGASAYWIGLRSPSGGPRVVRRPVPAYQGEKGDPLSVAIWTTASDLRAKGAGTPAVILAAAAADIADAQAHSASDGERRARRVELERLRRAAANGLVISQDDTNRALDAASRAVFGAPEEDRGASGP